MKLLILPNQLFDVKYIDKEYSNSSIIIETNKKEKDKETEIVEDVLNILNVYTAKINGMRKYKK
jgi:predicted site-specific integrase-resolvase